MTGETAGADRPLIRETFDVHDTDDGTVAVIADPYNEAAWVESDVVRGVVP